MQASKIKSSITLISQRVADPFVGWIVIDEFEDLFVEYTCATLCAPISRTNWQGLAGKLKRKLVPDYTFDSPPPGADILFVVARAPIDLSVIRAIPDLKKRFSRVVAFLIDGYFLEGYPSCTSEYDQIFVTNMIGKKHVEDNYGVKCSIVRQGFDCLRWSSVSADRSIDILGFGRLPPSYHQALIRRHHNEVSPYLYLHSPLGNTSGSTVVKERAMLYKVLQRSKIALAFHMLIEPPPNRPVAMFLTNRWFETLGAGCVVVGKRPTGEMADEILSWKDATFELPDSPEDACDYIAELIEDRDKLAATRELNVQNMRNKHDWRFRIEQMLEALGVTVGQSLIDDINLLRK
jgi:Glycosyl transferases group 1